MLERRWHLSAHLTCGHVIDFGVVAESELEELIPRRKDGGFAALKCPHGRRRVVYTHSSTTRDPNVRMTSNRDSESDGST